MRKLTLSLAILSAITLLPLNQQATAQSRQTYREQANNEFFVRGHVIDAKNGDHIPYATVAVVGTTIGVASDATGHFTINTLPAGVHTLQVSTVGYTPVERQIVVTDRQGSIDVEFRLAEDAMSLDQVVVSANRSQITRRESPTVVSVMPAAMFAEISAPTLADGLSFQPGLRVEENCQNCGFTQVRINGLDGHYSQILIDSRPMFSALTGVYGLEQIPANMVDRVEVVRGGGSALFGSSAIGGTINVITKTPTYNSAEFGHNLGVIGVGTDGAVALDNNTTANIALVTDNQRAGATLFGQVRTRGSYDADGDGYTEIPELKSRTIGLRSFLKTGDYSKLSLQYDASSDYRRGGNMLDVAPHEADIAEQIEHTIHGGGVNFDLFSRSYNRKLNIFASSQHTHRDSYYGAEQDPDAYGTTTELIAVTGAQFSQSWDRLWFMPAEFVGGVEYNYNNLLDENVAYDHELHQKIHIYSAYAQNEWRNDKFGVLFGVRVDKHSLLDKVIASPRLNLRYNPSKSVNFRASYAEGFRAPQAFDEDLHIAVVGGERIVTVLAENLKEERSRSFSASADMYKQFGRVSTNLLVEGFYTDLRDAYAMRQLDANTQERYNGSGARVYGATAEARLTLPSIMELQGSFTYQKSRYNEAEEWSDDESVAAESEMFRSPDMYGYIMANFPVTKDFKLSLSGTYTGPMLVQHLAGSGTDVDVAVRTPHFFDMNLRASYSVSLVKAVRMELFGSVQNIFNQYQKDFDTGLERDPGYVYGPLSPRSINCGMKLMF